MKRLHAGRLILVLAVITVILALASRLLKDALGIPIDSHGSALVGGVVVGGGILGSIGILNWLVSHGHLRWLERQKPEG